MSGIIAVYGLVVSVLIVGNRKHRPVLIAIPLLTSSSFRGLTVNPALGYSLYAGAIHLAAGLSCGLTGLAAGYAIGIVGDSVRFLYLIQLTLLKQRSLIVRASIRI